MWCAIAHPARPVWCGNPGLSCEILLECDCDGLNLPSRAWSRPELRRRSGSESSTFRTARCGCFASNNRLCGWSYAVACENDPPMTDMGNTAPHFPWPPMLTSGFVPFEFGYAAYLAHRFAQVKMS